MSSRSDRPHTLPSDSPFSSLFAPPTRTHAAKKSGSRKTPKQVKISAQCESHTPASYATTIDMLTDNVLLEIFDFIRGFGTGCELCHIPVWKWHILVHVCRRWRQIIFASPLRLDLQLLCTHGTPVRKGLGCWPAFPIVIDYNCWWNITPNGEDNVVAALEHPARVRQVRVKSTATSSLLEKMATVMQGPFPMLRHLSISSQRKNAPILPDGFLGGSAPCLREIWFIGIPFPALPTLLSSASDLVELVLVDIPQTGHISPAALVACLAVLPKLEYLSIGFHPLASSTDRIHLPPETRVVLPSLTSFLFKDECAYLEDFVAQIDTPRLDSIGITYSHQLDFQVPQLSDFIDRLDLKPSRFRHAEIYFDDSATISFCFCHEVDPDEFAIAIHITTFEGIHAQIWDMAEVLSQTSAMLSGVVHLEIKAESHWRLEDDDDMDDVGWLELLRPFTAVETLRVSEEFAESVTDAFENITVEMATQVLPALDLLSLEDRRPALEGHQKNLHYSRGLRSLPHHHRR